MIESRQFYKNISSLCLQGIINSFDPVIFLTNKQLRNKEWASTLGTEELTSTAICLIGLFRSGLVARAELDIPKVLAALTAASKAHAYPGGIGLVIWANAVAGGMELSDLLDRAGYPDSFLEKLISRLTTMESSWLLSGLLHEYKRLPTETTRQLSRIILAEVMERFNEKTSLFHHAAANAPIKDRIRRRIANFADQIYAVQALSYAAIVTGQQEPLRAAGTCARRLIDLQGPLGQWWWHYDSVSGKLARAFPVYSVHQHAMAPMALMALTAAGGGDFAESISLSQQWLQTNELAVDMVDKKSGTIWRDISLGENYVSKYMGNIVELLGIYRGVSERSCHNRLRINYETRPYEWAWCLCAGAMSAETPTPTPFIV